MVTLDVLPFGIYRSPWTKSIFGGSSNSCKFRPTATVVHHHAPVRVTPPRVHVGKMPWQRVHVTLVGEMRVLRVKDEHIVGAKTRVGVSALGGWCSQKSSQKGGRKGRSDAPGHATLVLKKRYRWRGRTFTVWKFFHRFSPQRNVEAAIVFSTEAVVRRPLFTS